MLWNVFIWIFWILLECKFLLDKKKNVINEINLSSNENKI